MFKIRAVALVGHLAGFSVLNYRDAARITRRMLELRWSPEAATVAVSTSGQAGPVAIVMAIGSCPCWAAARRAAPVTNQLEPGSSARRRDVAAGCHANGGPQHAALRLGRRPGRRWCSGLGDGVVPGLLGEC